MISRLAVTVFISLTAFFIRGEVIAQERVGITSVIVQTVRGLLEEDIRKLVLKDNVYQNETIQTDKDSASEITFMDQTKITLGPNARLTLDRFVFDPDPSRSAFVTTVTQGVFRFVSGNLPKKSYQIRTPTVVIVVRGTSLMCIVWPDGSTTCLCEKGVANISIALTGQTKSCSVGELLHVTTDGQFQDLPPGHPIRAAAQDQMSVTVAMIVQAEIEPAAGGPTPPHPDPDQAFIDNLIDTLTDDLNNTNENVVQEASPTTL